MPIRTVPIHPNLGTKAQSSHTNHTHIITVCIGTKHELGIPCVRNVYTSFQFEMEFSFAFVVSRESDKRKLKIITEKNTHRKKESKEKL